MSDQRVAAKVGTVSKLIYIQSYTYKKWNSDRLKVGDQIAYRENETGPLEIGILTRLDDERLYLDKL